LGACCGSTDQRCIIFVVLLGISSLGKYWHEL
jgi:hypothetical protein